MVLPVRQTGRHVHRRSGEEPINAMPASILRVTIGTGRPERLDKALAAHLPEAAHLSRSRLARLIAEGAVSREGAAVTDPSARATEGEVYEIAVPEPAASHIGAEEIALDVFWEDDDLAVINKPPGLVVHPAPGTPTGRSSAPASARR